MEDINRATKSYSLLESALTKKAGRRVVTVNCKRWVDHSITNRDQLEDLLGKGRDLENVTLSRAVHWHI